MNILDNVIIISLIVAAFISGMKIADKYNRRTYVTCKMALQRQFARLQTGMDADDPCKPYIGDTDGDEETRRRFHVPQEFIDRLNQNKSATMSVGK